MTRLSRHISGRARRIQYGVHRVNINSAPANHSEVRNFHLDERVLAAQVNAGSEVIVCGSHSAVEVIRIAQAAQRARFGFR